MRCDSAERVALNPRNKHVKTRVIAKTKVLTVLESLPRLGKVKSRRLLEAIGIAESRRMQGLGEHQKAKLLQALEG